MKWIDTSDLELWASKPVAKADLPLLVSRLIRATTTKITSLNIPKGKSTNRGGWDGVVIASESSEFVPSGVSLWEFGTTGNAKGKAEDDYTKRTNGPEGYKIAEATFIFVTPQVWEKANEWVEEKKKEGKWKDVKVYNGSKLEEWLAIAPLQSYWLAKEIGRAPNNGVESAEDFWENWKTGPEYELLPEVVTVGREKESGDLARALQDKASVISIQASSRDEAIAFAVGAIMQFDTELKENILARCVVVESEGSFKTLVNNNEQLVIIAKLEHYDALHRAVSKGHFVILPLAPDDQPPVGVNLVLSRLHRDNFIDALVKSGVSNEKAQALSKESSRNITILRRLEKFVFDKPTWANATNIRDIIPALLVGRWDELQESDRQLVSSIANEPYDSYITKLAKWKHTQGTPVYQIGSKWRVSSPLDVWSYIGRYITTADLKTFKEAFLQATRYIKPALTLEPEKRFMAPVYGKSDEYSPWIREGLAQSLILIALYGDEFKIVTQAGGQAFADAVVFALFKETDSNLWCSIDDVLPLLAEASPTGFLSAVDDALQGESPVISGVFAEVESGITPISYHSGLLWALENLSWMPEVLSRVTLILAKLTVIDPGGRLSNRPANSLIQIFLPWHPQTFASLQQRMQTLELLANKYSDVAWNLLIKLLPQHQNGVAFPNSKCRWRKFNYNNTNITYPELFEAYSKVLTFCLSTVGHDVDKIVQLLNLSDVSQIDSGSILNYIKINADKIYDTDHKIWAELRRTLGQHRSHPTAHWAISEGALAPYVELYELFTPKSVVEKSKWLFQEQWPTFPEGGEFDVDKKEKLIIESRVFALQALEKEIGLQGIVELLPQVLPEAIGDTLGRLIETEKRLYDIFELLRGDDETKKKVLNAVLLRTCLVRGFQWIKNLYVAVSLMTADAPTLAEILIPIPQFKEVWDYIGTTPQDIQLHYWANLEPWLGDKDNDYKELGMQKLLAAERYGAALRQLGFHVTDIATETIHKVLTNAAKKRSADFLRPDWYSITRIFEELDNRGDLDDKRMSQLEIYYLKYLTAYGSRRKPKILHQELAKNPASFVELLTWVFKSRNEEQNEVEKEEDEAKIGLAEAGYDLLKSWKTIPGTDDKGKINYKYLREWINEVRKQAELIGRIEVADMQIANVLACDKAEDKDIWPSDEICEIIDGINTKSIRSNFHAAIFNDRGTTIRGVFDGGGQERELSVYFKNLAQKHAVRWPVTSAILEDLAKEYEAIGREEDSQASEMDLDY